MGYESNVRMVVRGPKEAPRPSCAVPSFASAKTTTTSSPNTLVKKATNWLARCEPSTATTTSSTDPICAHD